MTVPAAGNLNDFGVEFLLSQLKRVLRCAQDDSEKGIEAVKISHCSDVDFFTAS